MQVLSAGFADIDAYTAIARTAQAWLQARGLGQYIPAAHHEYAAAIRSKAEAGALYRVRANGDSIGFFSLDASASPWWPEECRSRKPSGPEPPQR